MSNNNHREILFRGFHPCEDGGTTIYVKGKAGKGRWVEGYYLRYGWAGKEKCYIVPTYASALYHDEVLPSTVCQYVGLTDKNGVKIFEGDCIQTYFSFSPCDAGYGVSQKPFYVKWEQGRTAFHAKKPNVNGMHLLDTIDFLTIQSQLYEVIGTKWDKEANSNAL